MRTKTKTDVTKAQYVMSTEPIGKYTSSALRIGDIDPYPQRLVGEFIGLVVANYSVNDEYNHVVLKVHAHALKAYAGQMFHLLCPSPDGAEVWMRRPMSVYRIDKQNSQIEFLYKTEGRGTRGMAMLKPGDEFNIAGPLGVGFKLEPNWKDIVVLGRGVGLATLAPLSPCPRLRRCWPSFRSRRCRSTSCPWRSAPRRRSDRRGAPPRSP